MFLVFFYKYRGEFIFWVIAPTQLRRLNIAFPCLAEAEHKLAAGAGMGERGVDVAYKTHQVQVLQNPPANTFMHKSHRALGSWQKLNAATVSCMIPRENHKEHTSGSYSVEILSAVRRWITTLYQSLRDEIRKLKSELDGCYTKVVHNQATQTKTNPTTAQLYIFQRCVAVPLTLYFSLL